MAHDHASKNAILVCIVEDEPLIRLETIDVIADAGYRTVDAGNADQAIQLLEKHDDIRVIVTDIDMPGTMDGLKLAHAVRNRWPPLEIIVVSGRIYPKDEELPSRAVFFQKPLSPDRLLAEIRRFSP